MRIAFNLAMDHTRRMREPQFISLSEIDPDRLRISSFEEEILRDELAGHSAYCAVREGGIRGDQGPSRYGWGDAEEVDL